MAGPGPRAPGGHVLVRSPSAAPDPGRAGPGPAFVWRACEGTSRSAAYRGGRRAAHVRILGERWLHLQVSGRDGRLAGYWPLSLHVTRSPKAAAYSLSLAVADTALARVLLRRGTASSCGLWQPTTYATTPSFFSSFAVSMSLLYIFSS
jgi:hypothetical protein